MAKKFERATTADGKIVWINTEMVVSIARSTDYDKVDISVVTLVNGIKILLPGTPDHVMMTIIGT